MFEIGGGEGRVVSVRTFAVVAAATVVVALLAAFVVVAGCGLLGGFLGLGVWLRCVLGACAKSVWICFERLEGFHIVGSAHDEADVYHSLSRTKEA
jgi:hypothetical protein